MKQKNLWTIRLLNFGILALMAGVIGTWSTGCANPSKGKPGAEQGSKISAAATADTSTGVVQDSSVEIDYTLGHDQHRFWTQAKAGSLKAQTIMDRQIIKEGAIDKMRYQGFFQKASQFVTYPKRVPADAAACRAPFTVTVKLAQETKSVTGCRSTDDGALSRLVRDGEFLLLYSKK